eukprot:9191971-Prorocentrum_lima.AAC.1
MEVRLIGVEEIGAVDDARLCRKIKKGLPTQKDGALKKSSAKLRQDGLEDQRWWSCCPSCA